MSLQIVIVGLAYFFSVHLWCSQTESKNGQVLQLESNLGSAGHGSTKNLHRNRFKVGDTVFGFIVGHRWFRSHLFNA